MKIKVAKPGKMMGQPPKNPNSGKLDSQIFIGKEDPQHATRKKKKKKKKKKSCDNGSCGLDKVSFDDGKFNLKRYTEF